MSRTVRIAAALAAAFIGSAAGAREGEIRVGEAAFPTLRWGTQQAQVDVANNSDYVKFVVAEIELSFEGAYLHPHRKVRSHFALAPLEADTIRPTFIVPGNFGTAQAKICLYDVVDTLDDILPGQKFFEQPFMLRFHVPEALQPRMETRLSLPPRVESHPFFDNEFSRLLLVLLAEGKSAGEIATMAECDSGFVEEQITLMAEEHYLRRVEGKVELLIPVIRAAEAEAARAKALPLADTLASIIAANLPRMAAVRDSLVRENKISADTMAFFDPGTVLFAPYPTVGALGLWWDLGTSFITRSAPLLVYDGTDLCNANIPTYMYVVEGGDFVNGHQYYAPVATAGSFEINFGDTIPRLFCQDDFMRWRGNPAMAAYMADEAMQPANYMVDTSVVRPAIEALTAGADSLLYGVYIELRDMAVDTYGHARLEYGYRYWFWNLTATKTLEQLVKRGAVTRTGNGQYRLTGMMAGS